jgi:cysteine dioxygenase type I
MIPPGLSGRDLSRDELRGVVASLADTPDVWQLLVRHDPHKRVYEHLWRDAHLDVWLICWWRDHDTGFHDHDVSSGAVHVVSGQLEEQRLRIGAGPRSCRYGPGAEFDFDASHVHSMRHVGRGPAVSIHAYSPALWRMGTYAVDDDGLLVRESVSYAEELRAAPSHTPAGPLAGDVPAISLT